MRENVRTRKRAQVMSCFFQDPVGVGCYSRPDAPLPSLLGDGAHHVVTLCSCDCSCGLYGFAGSRQKGFRQCDFGSPSELSQVPRRFQLPQQLPAQWCAFGTSIPPVATGNAFLSRYAAKRRGGQGVFGSGGGEGCRTKEAAARPACGLHNARRNCGRNSGQPRSNLFSRPAIPGADAWEVCTVTRCWCCGRHFCLSESRGHARPPQRKSPSASEKRAAARNATCGCAGTGSSRTCA